MFGLLALSESIAERLSLQRWHGEDSIPGGTIELPLATQLAERARAVSFTVDELRALGVRRDMLEPFILHDDDRGILTSESTADSTLERHPLIDLGGDLILALPHAVSPAIVRYVLAELRKSGYLKAFTEALANFQARQVVIDGLGELQIEIEPLPRPQPNGIVPPLSDWLFKYDTDKYLHVVLLNDRIDLLEIQGLSSHMQIPEIWRAGLEEYLHQMSSHCRSFSGFAEGMTLLIFGGLGRIFPIGIKERPKEWRLSALQITDLIMLAGETDGSVARYLKFIKQKEWVEGESVSFFNIDGDYNTYCYWRQQNYKLVPRELRLNSDPDPRFGFKVTSPLRFDRKYEI